MSFRQENEFYEGTKGEHLVRLWGSEENFRSIQTEEEYGTLYRAKQELAVRPRKAVTSSQPHYYFAHLCICRLSRWEDLPMEKEEDARFRVKSEDLPIKILEEDTSDKQNLSRALFKNF